MGMKIEKIIEIYNEPGRISGALLRGNTEEETNYNTETIEALQGINVILHKYQKIEQIIKNDFEEYHPLDRNPYKLYLIRKVIEDGKVEKSMYKDS